MLIFKKLNLKNFTPILFGIFLLLFISLTFLSDNVFAQETNGLVSYWKFDGNFTDYGTAKVELQNTTPVFICPENHPYCFSEDQPIGNPSFSLGVKNQSLYFDGSTFVSSGEENEHVYDFLNSEMPFTIEWWTNAQTFCDTVYTFSCGHQYIFSKAATINGKVSGFAIGLNKNGEIFAELRNPDEKLFAETISSVANGNPSKFTVIHDGSGSWDGLDFYVNGTLIEKKPFDSSETTAKFVLTKPTTNNASLVIGNYWYTKGWTFSHGWIDEVKIFNHSRTSDKIKNDFQNEFLVLEKIIEDSKPPIIDNPPVSYWKFENNLIDDGTLQNSLYNTEPVFICGINDESRYCFDEDNPNLAKLNFINSIFGSAHNFTGFTFFTTGEEVEHHYDFLDSSGPFTIEWWMAGDQFCHTSALCYHQYLFSKVKTEDTSTRINIVTGFGVGIDKDGGLFFYLRNPENYAQAATSIDVTDIDIPRKYSVVYDGSRTWDGIEFFVNGKHVEKLPLIAASTTFHLDGSTENDQAFVIGNYWYRNAEIFRNGWIDEVKIFDYERDYVQISDDYESDFNKVSPLENELKIDNNKIPSWFKNRLGLYSSGALYPEDLFFAFVWLEKENIIESKITYPEAVYQRSFVIPEWAKEPFLWYFEDKISDDEILNLINELIKKEIIYFETENSLN